MLSNWWYPPEEGNRSSVDDGAHKINPDDDSQAMEPDQGNVLSHIISQLKPGADLSRVTLPTFILEPRSMLERITNFMCHPEMLLHIPTLDDPVDRFVSVVKFYLSGWHIRPPGVKKPLNPILGELFSCYWNLEDGKHAYYISEQTSHHPPKSSYFYMAPHHHIRIDGTLKPRSKFLGNSAASLMEGVAFLSLLNRGADPSRGEQYILTQPNMYARGILFGKMKYELGDHSIVRCPELDLTADIEFKVKGWVGGTYNGIGGVIKKESTGEVLFELSGLWSDEMFIKDATTGHREMFFNANRSKPNNPRVRPLDEQADVESQKLWSQTANAVRERNHVLATDAKTAIEDRQREKAAKRAQDGLDWHPSLFRKVQATAGGPEQDKEALEWIIDAHIDTSLPPEKQIEQILAIYPIIDGQKAAPKQEEEEEKKADEDDKPADEDESPKNTAAGAPASVPAPLAANSEDTTAEDQKPHNEVEETLAATSKPADGPLIDLAQNVKKSLPDDKSIQG